MSRVGIASLAALVVAAVILGFTQLGAQGPGCATNPIVCENQLPGNPASEWDVVGAGDSSIQGFATDISVNRGQTINFKVNTPSNNYRLDIYRMGYYGGMGARFITSVTPSASLPQSQPACLTNATTGLIDCGNWAVSASWAVPATATSGIYFAKARRIDTGGSSHIFFIVRDDASTADLLFQTADTTWQAYNAWGGNSLYVGGPGTNPGRAYKVSYNRPFSTRANAPEDWVFNAEYPMVRYLEANGFNVAYQSGIDTDRLGAAVIQQHQVFLSVGHDEYWSGQQRANVEAARSAGVHLAFFSGNEVFWKTRWENSISSPNTAYRTLVSYKETHANAKIDPSSEWTGTWRDPRFSPPSNGGRPENALTGTIFMVNAGTAAIQVPEAEGKLRFWRGTTVATQSPGGVATLGTGTLGYEWDEELNNGFRPAGLMRLSDTTVNNVDKLQDYGSTYAPGTARHALTLYKHTSGALVFGAGTVQWSWGLDNNHDRGPGATSLAMQQATVNLFADMGVQPLTLQPNLSPATPSSDNLAPASAITSPANNAGVPANTFITITGTATDNGGGQVAAVEVSTDGGTTWQPATGRGTWTFSWQTGGARTATVMSRAIDDSANRQNPPTSITVSVGSGTATCPCTIWSNTQAPSQVDADPTEVELGTRFRSDINGYISAIRFYKVSQNTGIHTGSLWSATGTRLANVTFTNETASGWQQAQIQPPVAVTANTVYIVSYHTNSGFYSGDDGYFASAGVDNGPLHALRDGVSGANGLYRYGPSAFPNQTYQSEGYWVDVVFVTSVAPDTTPPTVSQVSPANGATGVSATGPITVTFSEPMSAASVNTSTFELRNSSNTLVTATVSLSGATATLQPSAALAYSSTYTARVRGGSTGVKDTANLPLAADHVWSFTTQAPPPPPPTTGPGGPILVVSSPSNPFTTYFAEILRTEGLNAFSVMDLSQVTTTVLNGYDVVILGEMTLTTTQVSMFTSWVNGGGNLIAMRPDKKLASLLGLTDATSTLSEGYMTVNTSAAPGAGIVGQSMQYHGIADRYNVNGATVVATLYSSATTATTNPAVTVRSVGTSGGQAAAFTYDLAKSVVFTRQGNPSWSGQERDGQDPIRSDDLFFGGSQANYVNLAKVAIPQADEQQRLLANLIGFMNADKKPLPRFWYFPRGLKAVVVMTGDDHANNGTTGRFNDYIDKSPAGCNVANWECVRGTSYIFPQTPISSSQVASYIAQGFEIGVHMWSSGDPSGSDSPSMVCHNYTPTSLAADYEAQLSRFGLNFPGALPVRTNRTHCIVWSDYDTQPQIALANGIRLDTNYYYWPASWVNNVPGLFTGSGMPMRFARSNGAMIDVYQAPSQMTDESGQAYPFTSNTLLDRAVGPEGYYGAFVANMHTDIAELDMSDAIVASAQQRGVPVISAKQLLDWLDGRNGSVATGASWNGTRLTYTLNTASGANGLQTMLPATFGGRPLSSLTRGGTPVSFTIQTIKGVSYAVFDSVAGNYAADYSTDSVAPVISGVGAAAAATSATVSWTTNEVASSSVSFGTSPTTLGTTATVAGQRTAHTVSLHNLTPSTTYYYRVTSGDLSGNTTTSPAAPTAPLSFTTLASPYNCPCTIWPSTQTPAQVTVNDSAAVELGVKWRSLADGYVTAIRFYKGPQNTGVHTGTLWTGTGTLLSTVTFQNETAAGWQQALLPVPIAVTANTTYLVSYHTNTGFYSADGNYFASATTNGPLVGLATGTDGPNGVYRYGASGFPSESFNASNYWVDVQFEPSVVFDSTAPTVTGVTPANGSTTVPPSSEIRATFSENVGGSVSTATFELRDSANALVPATVAYDYATNSAVLQPNAALVNSSTYTARVISGANGIKDPIGNPLAADFVWSFTTLPMSVTDTTFADFAAGTLAGTYVTQNANGEVILAPTTTADFSGPALPEGWAVSPWQAGGAAAISNGAVVVDASRLSLDALSSAGVSLEFRATIGAVSGDASQHAGFGVTMEAAPWAIFSTAGGGALYARTNDGTNVTDTPIPGSWLGTPHIYRIDWEAGSVAYYIDGALVATHTATIGGQMRPLASDFTLNAGAVLVNWLRLSPFAISGNFTSRVLTPGGTLNWTLASWTAAVPPSTTMDVAVRFGNTPTPDASWTPFTSVPSTGSSLAQNAMFLQYRVEFAGTGTSTPVLSDITFSGVQPPPPTIAIDDVSVNEGDSGITNLVFAVTSSYPSTNQVRVNYATSNGTASSSSDYTATSGTLIIPAGQSSATISVPVTGDITVEANETLTVTLSSPVNGVIADAQGIGTILNDDQVRVSVNSITVNEPSTGSSTAQFTVSLSQSSSSSISVTYSTANNTAVSGAGGDYNALAPTVLTFSPGQTSRTVNVTILGDSLDENSETFFINLSNPVNAILGTAQGTVTINDTDSSPSLTITNATVTEGTNATATFTVTLSPVSGRDVTVNYATANNSAVAPGDYTAVSGTLIFPAGTTNQQITVSIIDDSIDEPSQTFNVNLSGAVNANISDSQGVGTINDNDGASASLAIGNASVTEGNSGTRNITFTVTLTGATEQTVTVNWATQNGTAVGGLLSGDFVTSFNGTASGSLSFSPGATQRTLNVSVRGDRTVEANETFNVNLSGASNATISDGTGVGTITNDD